MLLAADGLVPLLGGCWRLVAGETAWLCECRWLLALVWLLACGFCVAGVWGSPS